MPQQRSPEKNIETQKRLSAMINSLEREDSIVSSVVSSIGEFRNFNKDSVMHLNDINSNNKADDNRSTDRGAKSDFDESIFNDEQFSNNVNIEEAKVIDTSEGFTDRPSSDLADTTNSTNKESLTVPSLPKIPVNSNNNSSFGTPKNGNINLLLDSPNFIDNDDLSNNRMSYMSDYSGIIQQGTEISYIVKQRNNSDNLSNSSSNFNNNNNNNNYTLHRDSVDSQKNSSRQQSQYKPKHRSQLSNDSTKMKFDIIDLTSSTSNNNDNNSNSQIENERDSDNKSNLASNTTSNRNTIDTIDTDELIIKPIKNAKPVSSFNSMVQRSSTTKGSISRSPTKTPIKLSDVDSGTIRDTDNDTIAHKNDNNNDKIEFSLMKQRKNNLSIGSGNLASESGRSSYIDKFELQREQQEQRMRIQQRDKDGEFSEQGENVPLIVHDDIDSIQSSIVPQLETHLRKNGDQRSYSKNNQHSFNNGDIIESDKQEISNFIPTVPPRSKDRPRSSYHKDYSYLLTPEEDDILKRLTNSTVNVTQDRAEDDETVPKDVQNGNSNKKSSRVSIKSKTVESIRDSPRKDSGKLSSKSSKRKSSQQFNTNTISQLLSMTQGTLIGSEFSQLDMPLDVKRSLEKLVDSLSRLTADMYMNPDRHDECLRRLQRSIDALEGF